MVDPPTTHAPCSLTADPYPPRSSIAKFFSRDQLNILVTNLISNTHFFSMSDQLPTSVAVMSGCWVTSVASWLMLRNLALHC